MAQPHPQVIDPRHPLVERVREICMRYPDAVEIPAWGRPTFRAGKKMFVVVSSSMDRPLTIVFKPGAEERLAYLEDARFYVPPYFGPSGWMAVGIDSPQTDWAEIAELIDASYRQVALVRQIRRLDENTP